MTQNTNNVQETQAAVYHYGDTVFIRSGNSAAKLTVAQYNSSSDMMGFTFNAENLVELQAREAKQSNANEQSQSAIEAVLQKSNKNKPSAAK